MTYIIQPLIMDKIILFREAILSGYNPQTESLILGCVIYNGEAVSGTPIEIPLKTLNRHGIIAGATGTGKTKTMQGFVESLSLHGILCLLMDVKGDLSGLGTTGTPNDKIEERHQKIGTPWQPASFLIEFLTLSKEKGARLRATVS